MSYILDALRKSEEERQKRSTRPAGSRYTFVRDNIPAKKKVSFGLILTACMLLAALILGAGWWWSHEGQQDMEETSVDVQSVENADDGAVSQHSEIIPPPSQQETSLPAAGPSAAPARSFEPLQEIPYLSEMSGDFQAGLPELQFSGHVYSSEPGLRLIMINNKVVREGDPVDADLWLDEISEDGVVMRYGQTRFRITLF